MTASCVVDLYEQMLHKRAAKGIRPVLYISSQTDLECSVQMLLNEAPQPMLAGHWQQALGVRGRRGITH